MNEMNEVEREFKSKATVSRKFTIPELFWDEWVKDCELRFNNTYHLKMQFDHEFRKQFETVSALIIQDMLELKDEVFELNAKISSLEEELMNKENKTEGTKTFGAKR